MKRSQYGQNAQSMVFFIESCLSIHGRQESGGVVHVLASSRKQRFS